MKNAENAKNIDITLLFKETHYFCTEYIKHKKEFGSHDQLTIIYFSNFQVLNNLIYSMNLNSDYEKWLTEQEDKNNEK